MLAKKAEVEPWAEVYADVIDPYTIHINKATGIGLPIDLTLTSMTFIYPVTGWLEIAQVPDHDKSSVRISQLFNQIWLCSYP